jgi:hypothetical protein
MVDLRFYTSVCCTQHFLLFTFTAVTGSCGSSGYQEADEAAANLSEFLNGEYIQIVIVLRAKSSLLVWTSLNSKLRIGRPGHPHNILIANVARRLLGAADAHGGQRPASFAWPIAAGQRGVAREGQGGRQGAREAYLAFILMPMYPLNKLFLV